jgi:hypothetical protein
MTAAADCEVCGPPEPRPSNRKGSKITLIAVPGMKFGKGTITDPEVRVPRPPGGSNGRTITIRCARLLCDCGTTYLATLSSLFNGQRKSCGCLKKSGPGLKQVYVQANKGGYTVVAYLGWVKTREEAEDVARRSRVVVAPRTSPITGI